MNSICHTMQDPNTGLNIYEQFTTKGIEKKYHKYLLFSSHYMINILPRAGLDLADQYSKFLRTTDMVWARGLLINLQVQVAVHSGYRLHLIMFQTPYNM